MSNLDFIEFYERFYDFYYNAVKYGFYNEEIENMKDSIDFMYLNIFKKGRR